MNTAEWLSMLFTCRCTDIMRFESVSVTLYVLLRPFVSITKWTVTFSAAPPALTCSFSPYCSSGLLVPLYLRCLPLALHWPLFFLAWWEVHLTSLWELHTDMPLSVMGPRSQEGSDGKTVHSAYGHTTTKHYTNGCFFPHSSAAFHPFLHYTLNKNAMEIIVVQLLPQAVFKSSSTRVEVN